MPDIRIFTGDAKQIIRTLPENHFDLIILDPDYNDWSELIAEDFIEHALSALKDSGNIICFTKQPFDFELRVACHDYLRRQFIWSFSNGGAWVSNRMPLVSFQMIYWLTKSDEFFFNPRTGIPYSTSTKSFKRTNKVFGDYKEEGRQFQMSPEGTWIRDHYHYDKPTKGNRFEKPMELLSVFIKCLCPERGMILDPFCGSGATGVVAAQQNKDWIGYEINPERARNAQISIDNKSNIIQLFPDDQAEYCNLIQ